MGFEIGVVDGCNDGLRDGEVEFSEGGLSDWLGSCVVGSVVEEGPAVADGFGWMKGEGCGGEGDIVVPGVGVVDSGVGKGVASVLGKPGVVFVLSESGYPWLSHLPRKL